MKSIFVLVLVLVIDGSPVDGKVGGPFENMAECEVKLKDAQERAKEKLLPGQDAAFKCVELTYKPKPVVLRRRGGNA